MDNIASPHEGIWTTKDLLAVGWGQTEVRHALAEGKLTRLRKGWYADEVAGEETKRAVRLGGVVSCVSVLKREGVWVPACSNLHLRFSRHYSDRTLPSGVIRCRPLHGPERAPVAAVDDLTLAVRSAWYCLSAEDFVVAADSLINLKKMTLGDISCALGQGDRFERVLALCAWAESGTETLTRLRLQRHGVLLQTQVQIGQIGRVDLLVGERLIIEVDSKAHHTGEENYRKDRQRDLDLRALGYIVVRLTYEQVMYHWDDVEPLILAMIRRGDQWWGSRRGRLVA